MQSSAHYEGLLPVGRSDGPPPIRPTTLENERFPNGRPSFRDRASCALSRFLFAFCAVVAATLAWLSYGDATRQMIANSYPLLGWLAPLNTATVQKAPDAIALAGSATPHPDRRQLDPMLGDLHAVRLNLDRIAVGQDLVTRSIDEIATWPRADNAQHRSDRHRHRRRARADDAEHQPDRGHYRHRSRADDPQQRSDGNRR